MSDPRFTIEIQILEDHIRNNEFKDEIASYIFANFISNIKAKENNPFSVIEECTEWYTSMLEIQDYYNNTVSFELRKRKISDEELIYLIQSRKFWKGGHINTSNLVNDILNNSKDIMAL